MDSSNRPPPRLRGQVQLYNAWSLVETVEYAAYLVAKLSTPTTIVGPRGNYTLQIPPSKLVLG